MNFEPVAEHQLLRDSVRSFMDSILPEKKIREYDRSRKIPKSIWPLLAAQGWLGITVPERFGGEGGDFMHSVILCEELSSRFPSLGTDWLLTSMTARLLMDVGSQAQKKHYLPRLVKGEFLMGFGMSEPGGGTDVLSLQTRAKLNHGEWIVNGQKLYTSLADDADAILVLCRTEPQSAGKRAQGLSLVLTDRHQEAVIVRRLELMGMRAACTCEDYFDNARAPESALVGDRGRGWYHLLASLDEERILCAAMFVGITRSALEQAIQYAKDRQAFGRSIGQFQAVQHPLAEVATELEQISLLTYKADWLYSHGRDCSNEAAMAKLAATETAIRATDKCMRVLGGYGLVEESPMERLFRDARLGPFSPISNEMVKNFLSIRMGLPKSY